jgi:hypothetical protein
MERGNSARTLWVLIAVMALIMVNTYFATIADVYSTWWAWTVFGAMLALVFVVLRWARRLTTGATLGLLALPFALSVLGAAIGI